MNQYYQKKIKEKFIEPGCIDAVLDSYNKQFDEKESYKSIAKELRSDHQTLKDINNGKEKYEGVFKKVKDKLIALMEKLEHNADWPTNEIDKYFEILYPSIRIDNGKNIHKLVHHFFGKEKLALKSKK